ncbi:hypothetical protein AB4305_26205 [Nocardia sp. 2YAB30]|uniref:hypothetical protein n=1 Tax=unclassified Nocardia TaxID=2637762 RepID=UPI003F98F7AF
MNAPGSVHAGVSSIDQKVKKRVVANSERDTHLIFRTMHNTARVADNEISRKVVEIEKAGSTFDDVRDPVSGARGAPRVRGGRPRRDHPVGQLVPWPDPRNPELNIRMVAEAEELITARLAEIVVS